MTAYYNEHDPFAAEWLRQLMKHGHIAEGIVDERDIQDVVPSELEGFTQCHFFAGIGGWSRALRLAGWPDNKPVWTGSCPCQPFSQAGKGKGTADERHLWPAFHHLIAQHRPAIVFGEQVASKDGRAWLDTVQADLEGVGFAVGAADLCAAGIGAPHIRQRIWFVAERMADGCSERLARRAQQSALEECKAVERSSNAIRTGCATAEIDVYLRLGAGQTNGFWRDADWLYCRDGKWRPTQSIAGEMVDGLSDSLGYRRIGDRYSLDPLIKKAQNRVGRLSGYGNAIVPKVAQAIIESYLGR